MKEVQKVWAELAVQGNKVELNVVNDVKSLVKDMMSVITDEGRASTAIGSAIADYRQVVKEADAMSTKADSVIKEAEAAAKKLGISLNDIEDLDKLKKLMSVIEKYDAKYKEYIKAF